MFWKEAVWRRAFKYAVRVLAFTALWIVVGIVIAFSGIVLVTSAVRPGAMQPAALIVGFILFMLGYVVIYLGVLTALFRYLPQAVADEVEERRH
jgi:uncharacterized membrane protein